MQRSTPMRPGWTTWIAALLLAGLPLRAAALDELPLKAAIVYNLLLFVQWPDEEKMPPDTPLRLCADPNAALWPHLRALQGRPVRRFRLELHDAAAPSTRPCHATVLEDAPARATAARSVASQAGLTIGDGQRADETGVVIALRPLDGRVGFDIDMAAARAQRVQLSSKVLRLARVVRE